MKIGDLCNKNIIVGYEDCSLYEAAKIMRQNNIGSLVIVSKDDEGIRPVGMVTDRDIVIEVVAEEIGINSVTVKDIMSTHLIVARENDDTFETLESMCERGVRRIPVVDERGCLVGIFTTDDLLKIISSKLSNLALLMQHEQYLEASTRGSK